MSTPPVKSEFYADFGRMEALKKGARQDQPTAVREAARQFESLFTHMMLKSAREANLGEGLGDSEQTQFYQDMFDQQMAVQMSQGQGLGLAERLVQQLQRTGLVAPQSKVAAPIASAPPTAQNTKARFIKDVWPYAQQAAKRIGVAIESVVAHAALETGWGRHLPTGGNGSSNNLFGIKAGGSWHGANAVSTTTEFAGREASVVRAPFRGYPSMAAGMNDYADLLTSNPRFASALNQGSDAKAFALGLQRGGYATDPSYVHKLVTTAASIRDLAAHSVLKIEVTLPTTSGAGTA